MALKKTIMLLMMIMVMQTAAAEVFVFKIHYKDGRAEVVDRLVKDGFAPDRNIDEGDASFEMFDTNGNILEGFRFALPLREFVDFSEEGIVKGGVIVYTERDFGIVVPYHADAGGIRITHSSEIILYEDMREKFGMRGMGLGIFLGIAFGLIAGAIGVFLIKRMRKN